MVSAVSGFGPISSICRCSSIYSQVHLNLCNCSMCSIGDSRACTGDNSTLHTFYKLYCYQSIGPPGPPLHHYQWYLGKRSSRTKYAVPRVRYLTWQYSQTSIGLYPLIMVPKILICGECTGDRHYRPRISTQCLGYQRQLTGLRKTCRGCWEASQNSSCVFLSTGIDRV